MIFRVLLLAPCLAGCASSEWVRDYDGHVPWANPTSVYAGMVVDAATGAPLPGVSVRLYREDIRPEALPGELLHEARTDDFGVVSFSWRDEHGGCHFVFDHPGYAPRDELGGSPDWGPIELEPGTEWRGQLLDPQGQPAPGVVVELFGGCAHSPTVRTATTDAEGRFVLRDVAVTAGYTLWALAPGGMADYWPGRFLPVPGRVLETLRPEPGVTVTGTAYDANGQPAAGVVVYSTRLDRGPKTVTREDGTFSPPGARARIRRTPVTAAPPPPAPPPSNLVRVRPPGDLDKYMEFWIDWEEVVEPGIGDTVELRTPLLGPVTVSFRHEEYGEGSLVADVNASEVDVGPGAFPAPGFVAVVGPDGRPAGPFHLETYDETWGMQGDGSEEGPGVVYGWQYQPGTSVRLSREEHATNNRVLKGTGPYVLRLGGASLEINAGDAPWPVCWVDGEGFGEHQPWQDRGAPAGSESDPEAEIEVHAGREVQDDSADPADGGPILIRGLDPGPHIVLVGALGRRGKVLRVVLREGETRRIDLALEPR